MRILACDGGGVFGDVQSCVLDGMDILDRFDCFVGTSIGAAVVTAISTGRHSDISPSFFRHWMPLIFKRSPLRRFNPFLSKYPDRALNKALLSVFRGMYFREVIKPTFVTAADVGSRTLKVFNRDDDGGWMVHDVVRAATAAQTYFQPWMGYADGGVFANNPSMVGVAAAMRMLKCPMDEIEVLSIGTGSKISSGSRGPMTVLGWGGWLIQALLRGASDDMHDYFVRSMPLKRYVRIQFPGQPSWKMDDPKAMLEAESAWSSDIERARKIVQGF